MPIEAEASLQMWRIPPRAMTDFSQSQSFEDIWTKGSLTHYLIRKVFLEQPWLHRVC